MRLKPARRRHGGWLRASPTKCGKPGYQWRVNADWTYIGGATRTTHGVISAWENLAEKGRVVVEVLSLVVG